MKKLDLSTIDPNLITKSYIGKPDVRFFDAEMPPFKTYGIKKYSDGYARLPSEVANTLNSRARAFSKTSAGGRIRFSTDSAYVAIRARVTNIYRISMMTLNLSAGFDVYADGRFVGCLTPPYELQNGGVYEAVVNLGERTKREITVYTPCYCTVLDLEIGIDGSASLFEPSEYSLSKPVVFYGSSITNGALASRPGLTYPAIISRSLDLDYINLGFGAGCRGETSLGSYIGTIDASLLVCAYDHNAPNPKKLRQTHYPFYSAIRDTSWALPIVFVSRPDPKPSPDRDERRMIIKDSFLLAQNSGDSNVYFLDGAEIFSELDGDHTMDGIHPNDRGSHILAEKMSHIISSVTNCKTVQASEKMVKSK